MSPTLALSLLVLSKSRARAPVGSSRRSCWASMTETGFLHFCVSDMTGGWTIIFRFSNEKATLEEVQFITPLVGRLCNKRSTAGGYLTGIGTYSWRQL